MISWILAKLRRNRAGGGGYSNLLSILHDFYIWCAVIFSLIDSVRPKHMRPKNLDFSTS